MQSVIRYSIWILHDHRIRRERHRELGMSTPEDDELQRRFQALWLPGEMDRECPVRIGTEFLRQNRQLLES